MKYFESAPDPLLRPFVDRYWGWENEANEHVVLPTLLAGTGADLFLHYREPFFHTIAGRIEGLPTSHLVCVRQRALHLQPSTHLGFVAVRFRVGGLRAFTRIPGSELLDRTPSAAHLWPLTHRDFDADDRASSMAGCITRIERHLLLHLVPDPDLLALGGGGGADLPLLRQDRPPRGCRIGRRQSAPARAARQSVDRTIANRD
jgi:hypothetical protein